MLYPVADSFPPSILLDQEIGFTHMKILEGVSTVVQLGGLLARLCKLGMNPELFKV